MVNQHECVTVAIEDSLLKVGSDHFDAMLFEYGF